MEVLQLDGVKKSRGVDSNVADSQTWKTNSYWQGMCHFSPKF